MSLGLLIDNFSGGGGASIGIEMAMGRPVDIAINHDLDAITMHTANHPHTLHLHEDVFRVIPSKICNGRPVDVAWFSPDCTHFSRAKGSAPTRDRRIRGLAWVAVKWAVQVRPRLICLENVEEFQTWGPLNKNGKPSKKKAGVYFRKFIRRLENLGYDVDYRMLKACDYGAPTSRRRFFMIARCDGQPIEWPEATHGPGRTHYRTAAECIDWSIPTVSIFATKAEVKRLGLNCIRPLAENTLKRIARGVWKFIINCDDPYILNDEQTAAFMGLHYTGKFGYPLERPLATITQRDHHTLVAAMLTKYHGLQGKESRGYQLDDPMMTVDTNNRFGLVASYLTKFKGTNIGGDIREPLQTITAGGLHHGLVKAFLIKYYGQGIGQAVNDPMQTITSKDKFGLVTIKGETYQIEDIGLRMLQPHELTAAQGFPEDYILTGNKTSQVARIGNSVPPQVVAAMLKANIAVGIEAEAA